MLKSILSPQANDQTLMRGQRRAMISRLEEKRRRRRIAAGKASTPPPEPAITLTSDGHGHLSWTLNFTTPYSQVSIYQSADGVTWGPDAFDGWDLAAGSRDCSGAEGYFRICVADGDGADVLPYSNAVYSDGL